MDSGKIVIDKLNGSNCVVWWTQVEALLRACDTLKYIEKHMNTVKIATANYSEVKKAKGIERATMLCSI